MLHSLRHAVGSRRLRRSTLLGACVGALAILAGSFAPVLTLVGKTWALHLEKVTKVSPEENLAMIADSIAFCRERMAAYKYPRVVEFVDELPRTASGKVLRRVLRDG